MNKICIIGFNPAWQKTLFFPEFKKGSVNRARSAASMASGKGINAARAVRNWGKAVPCVYQFAGGTTGQKLLNYLNEEGICHCTREIAARTRTCTTQICEKTGLSTELVEPSPHVKAEEAEWLIKEISSDLTHADGLAICGTYPPGIPDDCYAKFVRTAVESGTMVLLDSFMHVEKALQYPVDILKVNREELCQITGVEDLKQAILKAFEIFKIRHLAVTEGSSFAWFGDREKNLWRIAVPAIPKAVNTIGSGDVCSAVMLSEIISGTAPLEAFRYGLAAASANCLTDSPGVFEREKAFELFPFTDYIKEN